MNEGDIALAALPQSDNTAKNRPVLVLRKMPPFNDLLVCGISTQLHQAAPGFDEIISPADSDFQNSRLRAPSVIRLGFLATLPPARFIGIIGKISPQRHRRLLDRLSQLLLR